MGGRDTKMINIVAVGGDAEKIQDNKLQRREEDILVLCIYHGSGKARQ